MSTNAPRFTQLDLAEIAFSPTAALWEGGKHAGTGTSIFVVKTPPGGFVHLHTHPYSETFVLLRGRGRWTAGDQVAELEPDAVLVVPPGRRTASATSAPSRCSSCPCTSREPSTRRSPRTSLPDGPRRPPEGAAGGRRPCVLPG